MFVLFIEPVAFVINVGIEPVPFAIIFVTTSNEELTLLISVLFGVIDDVVCEPVLKSIPLNEDETIVGIDPVPFAIILIILENEEDTNNLSDSITTLDDVV